MKLYLISAPALQPGYIKFLSEHEMVWTESGNNPDAQRLVEFSGRICYMSFGEKQSPRSNSEYIQNLINQAHESVLEHANFSILADGISRGLSHQIVRHRAGFSYSQLSQQYHDEQFASFVKPKDLNAHPDLAQVWDVAVKQSLETYKKLAAELEASSVGQELTRKERLRMIRSVSRSVLPAATETCLMITANARAWRTFLEVRGATEGDSEMLEFCNKAFRMLNSFAPSLFSDFEIVEIDQSLSLVKKNYTNK